VTKVAVVTGYVRIPGHPRTAEEYEQLGAQLHELRAAKIHVFRDELESCWLSEHVRDREVEHAVFDNPKKNTLSYHVVQHQKTAWLVRALEADPEADVFVWIDYGIFSQPGITTAVIDDFLRRVGSRSEIAIPGCSAKPSGLFDQPDWRFCGCSFVVARDLVRVFHEAVRHVTLERLDTTGRVTWEINDWAEVDRRKMLPIRWYRANHDLTQFVNYQTEEPAVPDQSARQVRYVYDPKRGSVPITGFPASILGYRAEGTTHIVPGIYERNLVDWAKELVPAKKQFVDCGAHMGSWTLPMAFHAREVHAFEPQRLIFQQLCGNVVLNGLTNVFARNVGLDQAPSRLPLYRRDVDRGASSTRADVAARFAADDVEMIDVVTLDSFAEVLNDVGLVKIDVEGLELRVLKGALEVLRQNDFPKIIFECWSNDWFNEDKHELLHFLEDVGYRIVPLKGYADIFLAEKPS
jgi:FkbM family methyltransferase